MELQNTKISSEKTKSYVSQDDMTCVHFMTTDQKVNYPIICHKNNVFAEIEEKLYLEYPEYRETNNYFLMDGIQILRFKTIQENKIKNGKPVTLILPIED